MKKIIAPTFCTLMIFSLLLTIGTVMAAEPGYERTEWVTQVIPTIDGMWTTNDEWTDGEATWIGTDVFFTSTRDGDMTRWIVEFLTDTTDDPGDYLRFCFDMGSGTDLSNPQLGYHYKFEITAHNFVNYYYGSEGDWLPSGSTYLEYAESFSASPTSDTPHWIYEFNLNKNLGTMTIQNNWYIFVEVYDASNPGFHAWPPTNPDIPEGWGMENYSTSVIPEGLTFAVMALLTTVSMLVGYRYFIKRKETSTQ